MYGENQEGDRPYWKTDDYIWYVSFWYYCHYEATDVFGALSSIEWLCQAVAFLHMVSKAPLPTFFFNVQGKVQSGYDVLYKILPPALLYLGQVP